MKKFILFVFVLTMALVFSVPVMAVPSYDSTVYVEITPDDPVIVLYGNSVEVTYVVSVTNISKSGTLPQMRVSPLGDNTECLDAAPLIYIYPGQTEEFAFTVSYTEAGVYDFAAWIRNIQGNSGKWNYEFTTANVSVTIVDAPEEESLPEGFSIDGTGLKLSKELLVENIGNFGAEGQNTTITITLDDASISSGKDFNTNNNGITIKKFEVGTYAVTNTVDGVSETFTFRVMLDENNSVIIRIVE
jgi:hypothetical protein